MSATLRVHEVFVSIQGEGVWTGVPSTFIRVSGCNLRCSWCDTPESSWRPTGERWSLDALVENARSGPKHIVLTGGEPALFSEVAELSRRLAALGHLITLETAGTRWLEGMQLDLVSLSPKLAHSTPDHPIWRTRHETRRLQLEVLQRWMDAFPWQLKFVVRADALEADIDEIDVLLERLGLGPSEHQQVLLMPECTQPARLGQDYAKIAQVCVSRGFRLGPRLHLTAFGHTPGT